VLRQRQWSSSQESPRQRRLLLSRAVWQQSIPNRVEREGRRRRKPTSRALRVAHWLSRAWALQKNGACV